MNQTAEKQCPFCNRAPETIIDSQGSVYAIRDSFPVAAGHSLVIPYRHTQNYFEMTDEERRDADILLFRLRDNILSEDNSAVGFNIGMNCGEVAGQTVLHAHIHLIPRRAGDTPSPRGGVRGVIPAKMSY